MVFFNFRKAFDVVSHGVLIEKLSLLGVSGMLLSWISDFLCDREMRVSVSGVCSSSRRVLSGVPHCFVHHICQSHAEFSEQ